MGIETILFAAFTGLQALSTMMSANAQADAAVRQGNIAMQEKAKETRYKAARQNVSFLNSGITLEGTPSMVIDETYTTGLADIKQIGNNANATASNYIAEGRTKAIGQIAGAFGNFAAGSGGSMVTTAGSYLPDKALFKLNDMGFGNDAFSMMEAKDQRMGIY